MMLGKDNCLFGMPMVGRKFSSTTAYRYGFNGKENDKETVGTGDGTQDYGMRIYNPALGRFLSVDPISNEFPWLTPYQFASNRPILAIDIDGLEAYDAPNSVNMFSMFNWATFIKAYSNKLLSDQKIKKIDDKDCADLAVEMMAVYHKDMGVQLKVTIKYESGNSVTIDSNDPKYQDNVKKDAAGNMYSKFDWFLDDLKKNIGPNGIPQISYGIKDSEAGTGDIALLSLSNDASSGYFHTQVLLKDDNKMKYIQASGSYFGRGNKDNRLANPLITTGIFDKSLSFMFRFNFLKGASVKNDWETPTYIESKKPDLRTPEPEIIIK